MAKNGRRSILDMFRVSDDDDEEYDDDYEYSFDEEEDEDDYEEPERKTRAPRTQKQPAASKPAPAPERTSKPVPSYSSSSYSKPEPSRRFSKPTQTATDKLVAFDGGASPRRRTATSGEVFVIKPQEFDDAQTVVDFLKTNRAIVINMEGLQLEPAQRIIDFIGGACYGIDGDIKAISANIFIAVPKSIEVSGDLREEILNSTSVSPILGQ